ncbi:sulfatase-like hydrolase/transferase [Pseudomonas delhiensis]|uniref:sulfatase-like hydrolase/transferase n=1 Tax=Pseudomonas delhiensis TaxID=366289 RepID=UPI00315B0B7E
MRGIFVGLYFLPVFLGSTSISIADARIRSLLEQALMVPSVAGGLFLFTLSNALLCGVALVLLEWIGRALARVIGVSSFLTVVCTLLFGWVLLVSANFWAFPESNYSVPFSLLSSELLGEGLVFVLLVLLCVVVFWEGRGHIRRAGLVVVFAFFIYGIYGVNSESSISKGLGRNVIIIGVDSLSAHVFEKHLDLLPNIAQAASHSQRYVRAYTPLGRTFPAWVALLSGKSPADNGAFFNLRNMEHVQRTGLLPSTLRHLGYLTVFAMDERRFSNIDESFGFDTVVGPRAGVLDFMLQSASDTPLSNLLLQTRLGGLLLPYSYINSAAYTSYSANAFVDSVVAAAKVDKPLFLAVHFESAHFPFKTRHAQVRVRDPNSILAQHLEALTAVDKQVGQLMQRLRLKGLLDNALLVILSDHGEGLGEVETMLQQDGAVIPLRGYGHGANILSDQQNRIVLAATRFEGGVPVGGAGTLSRQVSLLDVRRAIENYVADGSFQVEAAQPCLIVETGLRLAAVSDYRKINETSVVQQAASYYEVDSQGRMRLREDSLPVLLAAKDIGLRCLDRITWFESAKQRYLSYGLDDQGIPYEQRVPWDEDIEKIISYRMKYIN